MAWAPACSAAAAEVVSQATMGWAAAAAAADPAPVHCSVVSAVMIDSHWVAVVLSSAARFAPSRRGGHQRSCTRTGVHEAGVDLRWQSCEISTPFFCIPFPLTECGWLIDYAATGWRPTLERPSAWA